MACMGCRKDNASNNTPRFEECSSQKPLTFNEYMQMANSLMVTLRRPEDREFLEDIIKNIQKLNTSNKPEIKRYNTIFISYFVKLLQRHCATQPLEIYDQWYGEGGKSSIQKGTRTRLWLEENKSYFFMEKTADGAIIFYTAIACDPSAGWDKGGLAQLCQH